MKIVPLQSMPPLVNGGPTEWDVHVAQEGSNPATFFNKKGAPRADFAKHTCLVKFNPKSNVQRTTHRLTVPHLNADGVVTHYETFELSSTVSDKSDPADIVSGLDSLLAMFDVSKTHGSMMRSTILNGEPPY